jgi:hypothetical protein
MFLMNALLFSQTQILCKDLQPVALAGVLEFSLGSPAYDDL